MFEVLIIILFNNCKEHTSNDHQDKSASIITDTLKLCDNKKDSIIIDCKYTLEKATTGIAIPENIRNKMVIIDVRYFGFDSVIHQGQIVVADEFSLEVKEIFKELAEMKFTIEKVIPVVAYNWSDSLSMLDNNTSCFNYRTVPGCRWLSHHALGRAIDINPLLNPYYQRYTNIKYPSTAIYDTSIAGTLIKDLKAVEAFKKRGWRWGGDWYHSKDFQHFYKPIPKK